MFRVLTLMLLVGLASGYVSERSTSLVQFSPKEFSRRTEDINKGFFKTRGYCFNFRKLFYGYGDCSELEVTISDKCDNKPYDTFYVPCNMNVNTNSYIGYRRLRVWDYLYSEDAEDFYYMNSDGSCLKKTYIRVSENETNTSSETWSLTEYLCDKIKYIVNEEAGELNENIKTFTWYGKAQGSFVSTTPAKERKKTSFQQVRVEPKPEDWPVNPFSVVRFQASDRSRWAGDSRQSFIQTKSHCFKWRQFYSGDGKCSEIEIEISNECTNTPFDIIYVPCGRNVNINSYVGPWKMRFWDYLYSNVGNQYFYMNQDGSCLRKLYERLEYDTVRTSVAYINKEECEHVKLAVEEEAGELDENIVKLTWGKAPEGGLTSPVKKQGMEDIDLKKTPPAITGRVESGPAASYQVVRFKPSGTGRRGEEQNFLQTQAYCFKWQRLYSDDGKCSEVEIVISDKCDNKPYDTFYVPCDLNINTNSYIGYWTLRVWDYLYSDSGQDYYYMNSDGSCLKKTYRRRGAPEDDTVTTTTAVMKRSECDAVKHRVEKEAGQLNENIKKFTWTGSAEGSFLPPVIKKVSVGTKPLRLPPEGDLRRTTGNHFVVAEEQSPTEQPLPAELTPAEETPLSCPIGGGPTLEEIAEAEERSFDTKSKSARLQLWVVKILIYFVKYYPPFLKRINRLVCAEFLRHP